MEHLFRDEIKKVKKRKKAKSTLSFAMDDEEGDGEASSRQTPDAENGEPAMKRGKFGKNPNVDTSFLPDREREEEERRERERLRQEWLRKQEELKAEEIEVTYSYWDGSGHRKSVIVRPLDQLSKLPFSSLFSVRKGILSVSSWKSVDNRSLSLGESTLTT